MQEQPGPGSRDGRRQREADEVRRQEEIGAFNRRVAREIENGNRAHSAVGIEAKRYGEFWCACGRPDCDEVVIVPVDEHAFVRERPYRLLVATDHATEVDDLIARNEEYDVVEIKARYRDLLEGLLEGLTTEQH